MYPHRTAEELAALEHLARSPYATDDMPFLNSARYSLTGYSPSDLAEKEKVDLQGVADNLWWLDYNRKRALDAIKAEGV